MPDHWHALLELGKDTSLSRAMQRAKSLSARAANAALGRNGCVWSRAYHDRAVRTEENVIDFARYVVANPVRAGLVKSVRDYPYWNAVWL
jgi:putative transposase